jgi:UTP--glucose-1-phosphate uridylyltransferase
LRVGPHALRLPPGPRYHGRMKGVIVAAGYGTRFLPVTKTVPKELLPVGTRPAIAFIVDEFVASGIEEIVVISSRRKKVLEDYFDREVELEEVFRREGKADKLALVAPGKARVAFVRQAEMLGTGHALMQVKPFLAGEPCVVAYPDDLHVGTPPLARQLVEVYEKTGKSVLATVLEPGDVSRYGVVEPASDGVTVASFVEKPAQGKEPSHEVSIGRYLYTPEFFELLEEGWARHTSGEYFHTYALDKLIAAGKVAFARTVGERLDTGSPAGYLEAILADAASDPALRPVLERFARERL